MLPTLPSGSWVIFSTSKAPRLGDIVIARVDGREVVKRLSKIRGRLVWLIGDNSSASTDSRDYGFINKSAILGAMKFKVIPSLSKPRIDPKRAAVLGWATAVIMLAFATIHLFRIDTFVPALDNSLPGGAMLAGIISAILVCAEVFAMPFLLRIKLSSLAQYVSGAFAVIVPLFWLLVAIWSFNIPVSTGQFGEFKSADSNWLLVLANSLWLLLSYFTIWALGYDNRKGEKTSFVTRSFKKLGL